jgi:hypothetical protein
VVLFYSTFFFFFFLGSLLELWLPSWASYLIVFSLMVLTTGALAFLGFLKVRKIRGPRDTIATVKEAKVALTPGGDRTSGQASIRSASSDTSGW